MFLFNQVVALAHSDRDVVLYSREGGKQLATLDQHDLRVTGIDWAPRFSKMWKYTLSEE